MVDNLPLIPDKQVVCADVRPVLREVFRELDYLPPLAIEDRTKLHVAGGADCLLPKVDHWVDKYKTECKQIWQTEGELKQRRAMTICRKPLSNIYKIYAPKVGNDDVGDDWKKRHGILDRKDLMPSIEQNAGRSASLWIKNVLNRSSCEVSAVRVQGSSIRPALQLQPPDEFTLQSMSIGEVYEHHPAPSTPPRPETPQPEYIICVPSRLDFINFTIGQLHMQGIRLINVSKFEIRLSIRPPARKELDIELGGSRGLTVTSGAAAEIRVHFRPRDVRTLKDQLLVRVSAGKDVNVPIACFMQPPILEILVPSITSSMLTCTPGDIETCAMMSRGSDVLELGARLLGDVHCVKMLLHCDADHAELFVLTEQDWLSFCLDDLSADGSVVSGSFSWWPARWAGGGGVRAAAACRALSSGLHVAPLRLIASTAVARPLHLLADALMFAPAHITIQAQEKDYDICSEDDPACEYFVHLGTAFPGRSLTATVLLVNHSPVLYTYYWSVRPWGVCSCWEGDKEADHSGYADDDSERLCAGAKEANAQDNVSAGETAAEDPRYVSARRVRVEPPAGEAAPRSSRTLHVATPDAGAQLGTSRAVLMLVLKDIPKESFPSDYDPMVISSRTVDSEPIPGFRRWKREVCDVVCCQLEVWWEVAPVRFVLDPPVMPMYHSKRMQHIEVLIRATQLFGCEGVRGAWSVPPGFPAPPPAPRLTPANSCATKVLLALPPIPDQKVEADVITLVAADDEWRSKCEVWRYCASRHLSLRPGFLWLGIVPPGTHMSATLHIDNDTYQQVEWRCSAYRWHGENAPSAACASRAPCPHCLERACACALLPPAAGQLLHGDHASVLYTVNAPERDGCVCTVVRAHSPAAGAVEGAGACSARSAALAYRVLAPRLVLRVLPCRARDTRCERCKLDPGELASERGTATLRPRHALAVSRRTCYRLRLINITPLPTTIRWEPALEGDDILKVTFTPNDVEIASYGEVEIRVVLEALKVCSRRVFVLRALVDKAHKPLYLIIDAAIAGLEVVCEVPIGGGLHADATVALRLTQRQPRPGEVSRGTSLKPAEIFSQEDRRRDEQRESSCHCSYEMVYIPPVKRPEPPRTEECTPPVVIVEEPPPLTRVCLCCHYTKPQLPDHHEPICLQFRELPLRTVRSRRLVIRNESLMSARWSCAVRRWPRVHARTLDKDQWLGDVRAPGVTLQCTPAGGTLEPHSTGTVLVSAYAACWGLYRDQILVQVEGLEPLVLDVWVQAVGAPLHFAINSVTQDSGADAVLWMSSSDPERTLLVRNTSCADLTAYAYLLSQHEHPQDALPFRLYLRFYDAPPRHCPCLDTYDSDYPAAESSEVECSSFMEEMDTVIELYLAADYGLQDETCFKVEPEVLLVRAGAQQEWRVTLQPPPGHELASPARLLLRTVPVTQSGVCWHRPEPAPQSVVLRHSARAAALRASRERLTVRLCALHLPPGDALRIRKRFQLKNVGDGPLDLSARTQAPWCVVRGARGGGGGGATRELCLALHLPPKSSTEVCVEVRVHSSEACPLIPDTDTNVLAGVRADARAVSLGTLKTEAADCRKERYEPLRQTATSLHLYDKYNILLQIPLILELEFPVLSVKPENIDFGFVTDGDTRKTYFTVTHSSRTETLELSVSCDGDVRGEPGVGGMRGVHVELWPRALRLAPARSERVYVQYTARWCGAPVEWCVRVGCAGGGGAWCRAAVWCRATPARDHNCRATLHDHTDDTHLLPPHMLR